jgi:hypothetical protein
MQEQDGQQKSDASTHAASDCFTAENSRIDEQDLRPVRYECRQAGHNQNNNKQDPLSFSVFFFFGLHVWCQLLRK